MNASEFNTVSTKQQRIAELARQSPELVFTSIAHHMDLEWLREAHRRNRKNGAVGTAITDFFGARLKRAGRNLVARSEQ